MPIAFVTGGKDAIVPSGSFIRLAGILKQLKRKVLLIHRPDGGHQADFADAVAALEFMPMVGLGASLPTVTSGTLKVWLDAKDVNGDGSIPADGAAVTTWVNKAASGAGNFTLYSPEGASVEPTYTGSSSAFNYQPVVHFTAGSTGKWLQNVTDFGSNCTVIYVGRKNSTDWGRLVAGVANNWLLGLWGNNMNCDYWGTAGVWSGSGTSDNQAHIWIGTADGTYFNCYRADATGEALFEVNGVLGQGPNGLSLGGYPDETGGGDIGEVIVYEGALSPADRQSVENYLLAKWFPTPLPPSAVGRPKTRAARKTSPGGSRRS